VPSLRSLIVLAFAVTLIFAPPPGAQADPQGAAGATAAPDRSGAPGAAQAAAAPAQPGALKARVFIVRYRDVDDVYTLISPHLGLRGSVQVQPRRKAITVLDDPANLEAIAALIAGYDVPPRAVEVAVQLILASSGAGGASPAAPPIRGVIDRLSALNTRWNDYRVVGDARILGTEGEESTLRVGDDYRIDFRIEQVSDETRVIRFKPFELAKRDLSVEGERFSPVLRTVLNLRDAQQFIVGASKMERSNKALFMAITASLAQP